MLNQYFQNGRHLYELKIYLENFKKTSETKKMRRDTFKCSKLASFSQKNSFLC